MGNERDLWLPYPEEIKMTPPGRVDVEVTRPEHWHVVMGAGGKTDAEVHAHELQRRGIPLYKRKGGGGTVLLGPGTLVVTVHAGVAHTFRNLAYFKAINCALMDVFAAWKPLAYHQKGISDIAVGDRKIVGSSIFRRKRYLLYQASILVDFDIELMSTLLRHPPREPDYRRGRGHEAFLTGLRALGAVNDLGAAADDLARRLPALLPPYLREVDEAPGA